MYGLYYDAKFIEPRVQSEILQYIAGLYPIWEMRYAKNHPPPEGQNQRPLLRPVYWLGNWQFACLNYYHPPKGIHHRCVTAEIYPPILQHLVKKAETVAKRIFRPADIPKGWHLNTCLINFYGERWNGTKWVDTARVGEHKDFEPGPVASISLGERALIQFVRSQRIGVPNTVACQQWLDNGSLQIFGGERFKSQLFHRVQRVDHKQGYHFPINVEGFKTRRINFTFRYVPAQHIEDFSKLPKPHAEDVMEYVTTLAERSDFFKRQLEERLKGNR